MTAVNASKDIIAFTVESTAGTPVAPASATDGYLAKQPSFQMSPGFESLQNEEVSGGSIAPAKPIPGGEKPTVSDSHYLRASGSQGVAPQYKNIIKGVFGAESVQSTERPTVSSSTVSVIKVNTGIGAEFQRGELLLIKDAANGYRIRPVHSVSSDDLTLGFQLPTGAAPGSGVNLGKCALYYPANEGHQTLTGWHYMGNGGARQFIAGILMTEFAAEFNAGQLIKFNYKGEGLGYYFNGIEITSSSKYLDFTDDDGTWAAVIPTGWYKDPTELAAAVQTAMRTANTGKNATSTYSTSGTFTIKTTGTLLTLKWNTGTNTANSIASKIGFSTAADNSGTAATTGYTGSAQSYGAPHSPTMDSNVDPLVAKYNEVLVGDSTDYTSFSASKVGVSVTNTRDPLPDVTAQSGVSGALITERKTVVKITSLLAQHDADKFSRYRTGQDTRFFYAFGTKTGGNWNQGYCGGIYLPTSTVSNFSLTPAGKLWALDMELTAYRDSSGNGEVYLGFV